MTKRKRWFVNDLVFGTDKGKVKSPHRSSLLSTLLSTQEKQHWEAQISTLQRLGNKKIPTSSAVTIQNSEGAHKFFTLFLLFCMLVHCCT